MFALNQSLHTQTKKKVTPSLVSLPKLLPISDLIPDNTTPLCKDKLLFCYRAVAQALQACLDGDYTKFDVQTTTNCCHGISLLVSETIKRFSQINPISYLSEIKYRVANLEKNEENDKEQKDFYSFFIHEDILTLTHLYILCFVKEKDTYRGGWVTVNIKLKEISQLSTKFCTNFIKQLQFKYSNIVAVSYQHHLRCLPNDFSINNISIVHWGKYIQDEHLRTDKRGRKYAACLYSMQVLLAYLINKKIKIALTCDLKSSNDEFINRYIQVFKGDGHSNFNPMNLKNSNENELDINEPVIIFGGCLHSDVIDEKLLNDKLTFWNSRLPSLILACDTFYPQFPLVSDDPQFDSSPIEPSEEEISNVIDLHQNIKGVSALDPHLFCLTHVYVASMKQIQWALLGNQSALPDSFIPERNKIKINSNQDVLKFCI